MPSGKNWSTFLFINLLFLAYISSVFYLSSLQEIKANWPDYRCNPLYMPLSDNIEEDFTYCIQNMQTSYIGYLLQPITFITSYIGDLLSNITGEINDIRAMFYKVRTFISSIVQSVFGTFLNLVIEFQKITISIKDLMGKTIGVMVTLMYMVDGSIKTMNSTWNGPPGQMVQALGKCFHPKTLVAMQNGETKPIEEIQLDDILSDGSRVEALLKIKNTDNEFFYEVPSKCGPAIFVTGSHLIKRKKDIEKAKEMESKETFVLVKDFELAKPSQKYNDSFCCLITDTHTIPINEYIFWDWEDHYHPCKLKKHPNKKR
jgi:hypothetical protein